MAPTKKRKKKASKAQGAAAKKHRAKQNGASNKSKVATSTSCVQCSFTNQLSVKGHEEKKPKCKTSADTCFIVCHDCRGKTHTRCFACYKKLKTALTLKAEDLKDSEQMLSNDATKVVMNIDWKSAINCKKLPEKITIDDRECDVPISETAVPTEFKWNIPCQSCGNLKLPDEPALPIKEKLRPSLDNIKYHRIDVETITIDRNTFKPQPIIVHVELVIVKPLVDMDTISTVQHRRFGQDTIDGECIVFHSKPTHWNDDSNVYRIIATGNPTNPNELLALSSINFDKFSETVSVEEMRAYMKLIQCSVQPTFEEVNEDDKFMRRRQYCKNTPGGYRHAQLRCNRTNGAGGTNNGMDLRDIQEAQSSPNMQGNHCRCVSQTVQIAIASSDGLITSVPNYYHSPLKHKFTTSKFYAPTMKGSQAEGKSVLNSIQNPPEHLIKGVECERLIEIHSEFTLAKVECAFLNDALCNHPCLKDLGYTSVSSEATTNVLNSWATTLSISESGSEDDAQNVMESSTEAEEDELPEGAKIAIMKNLPYNENETVFYTCGGNPRDPQSWISGGKIITQISTDKGSPRQYQVDIGEDDLVLFDEFHLSGQPGIGNHSDEDLPLRTDAENEEMTRELTKITKNAVLLWSARSKYNVVFDAVAAHLDHFGKNKNAVEASIENGREIPIGNISPGMELPKNGSIVSFQTIPAALYMPRLGVATIRNIYTELLDLHQEYHCVLTQEKKEIKNTNKKNFGRDCIDRSTFDRGSWFRGKFYSKGGSLLDWGSRYSGQSATAVTWRTGQDRIARNRRAARRRR